MVEGGMKVVKCLVFAFNFVFVICGIALIAVGAQVKSSGITYTAFLDSKFVTAPIIIITLGVIIFFVAFLGACGALKQNYCMVMTFGALLFLIFIIELIAGGLAYAYRSKLDDLIRVNMETSLNNTEPGQKSVWDDIQRSMECCGVTGPIDYENLVHWNKSISEYCCDHSGETKINCWTSPTLHKDGCYTKMKDELKGKIGMVAAAGITIAVIEILGIIFAWCLGSAIKKEYEGV